MWSYCLSAKRTLTESRQVEERMLYGVVTSICAEIAHQNKAEITACLLKHSAHREQAS